jgi:Flp pilus assembly protein TadG
VHSKRGVSAIMTESMVPAFPQNRRRSGNSIIEMTFMLPWLLFLFVGVFDVGFYCYALIATQNAARAAAVHNSISSMAASDPDGSGCQIVVAELQSMSNARSLTCPQPGLLVGPPVWVTSTLVTGTDSPDGNDAAKVVVTYQTNFLIPIPGLQPSQLITRVAWMRVNSSADFPSGGSD